MTPALAQPLSYSNQPDYAGNLNTPQWEAVSTFEGPLLVLAGAGTGKTKVLTTRIAHMVETGYAHPSQVLAVTFTNKAALEMRERIYQLLTYSIHHDAAIMWIGTFHSIAARILRLHAEQANLQPNFTIIDSDDQMKIIRRLIKDHNLDEKQTTPRSVLAAINRFKDRGVTPNTFQKQDADIYVKIYEDYEACLLAANAVDFGGLLLHNLEIFRKNPDIVEIYRKRFSHILVDEYQDTNTAQYQWLRFLAQHHICCVGDDDQSIYGWRGAELDHILNFEQDFPNATIVRLEQNYRSTGHILQAASGIISHNEGRFGKTLWTSDQAGDKVHIMGTRNSDEEAQMILHQIDQLLRTKYQPQDIAILVRASSQTREFEDQFLRMAIPYKIIGGMRFYERQEIKDVIAYIRFLSQPNDTLAFERIINTPKRGIGNTTIQRMYEIARSQNISLPLASLEYIRHVSNKATKTIEDFHRQFDIWREDLKTKDHTDVVKKILDDSGYIDMWRADKTPESVARIENIKELLSALREFGSLDEFLEHVSLLIDQTNPHKDNAVSIMTLHAAKGLEFPVVFLPGWEEGMFPNQRALSDQGARGLEEERRLAYVGISRARQKLFITYSLYRRGYQGWMPTTMSRFIHELPNEACQHILPRGSRHSSQFYDF